MKRLAAMFLVTSLVAVLALYAAPDAGRIAEDEPIIPKAKAGHISGTISPPEKVASLSAVSRHTAKRYSPASLDPSTGRFIFKDLPGDASYDLCIRTADGRLIEGIDLEFADAALLRLAEIRRRELGIDEPEEPAFDADSVRQLLDYVRDLKDFMELRRVLYVKGQGGRATMLVELMRTREFYADKGDIVWRTELWYFQNNYGGWERLANQQRVLERRRLPVDQWTKIDIEYRPELSAYVDRQGASRPVNFTVSDRADPSRGRPAGTEFELKTQPHVMGLEEAATAPATQPAAATGG